jgi:hypothetical protein
MSERIELTAKDIIDHLRMMGTYNQNVRDVLAKRIAAEKAKKMDFTVSDEELQEAANAFRQEKGLSKVSDFQQWLKNSKLTMDTFEEHLERDILIAKLPKDKALDELTEEELELAVGGSIFTSPFSLSTSRFTPYRYIEPVRPIFNPYATDNATAGIRG